MKRTFTLLFLLALPFLGFSQQLPITPIQEIQGWQGQFLPDSCNEGPNPVYLNQTVRVRGVVIVPGGLNETTGQTRWIWIRDISASPSTPFGNITVRSSAATSPLDLNTLVAGDTIEVIGTVTEFTNGTDGNGETQLNPSPNGVTLISEEAGPAPAPLQIAVGQLNGDLNANNNPRNHIRSGEPLEGNFVEIQNVSVVQVQISGDRCRLLVKDQNNNHVWIYDRFRTQRISNGFVPPNVNDTYTSIRGVVEGWKNECPGTAATNRGYNINPFNINHYVKGASSPTIGNLRKSVNCPSSTNAVTISCDVTDDESVSSVEIFYSLNGTNYTALSATALGTRYSATIPAQSPGSLVRYYIRAKDNLNNTTNFPNVPANGTPLFYAVNNSGCTIRDMQFTPYPNGRSGYVGDTVTLQGIITASAAATNLGYVYMQQSGETEWGGIWVTGGALISNLNVGDRVLVTGVVEEYFGLTRLANVTNVQVQATGQPVPPAIELDPSVFSTYNFSQNEKYESMLVRLKPAVANQNLFVVDTNADAAQNRNNGEYRIGTDVNDPNIGCRVLAGRQNNTAFSSLNVSYVNSPIWQTVDGTMNVPLALVSLQAPVTLAQGVLTFSFSNMKLLPRNNDDISITVGNKPLVLPHQVAVYPNPTSGRLTLSTGQDVLAEKVEIYNATGQLVFAQLVSAGITELDLNQLPSGLYRLSLTDASGKVLEVKNISRVR